MAKWNRTKFWHDYVSLHGMLSCELSGWRHPCVPGYEAHHIISRHLLRGNKKALKHIHKHWYVFMACICPAAQEIADNWETRHIFLDMRVRLLGAAVVAKAVEGLLALLKAPMPELHRYIRPVPLTSPSGEEAV